MADRLAPIAKASRRGAAFGLVPYLATLWGYRFDPLRGSGADHLNGGFYDIQARALFHGNLDVPPGSLGIEAFVVDGRHHMYFGPFPALLRMPLLAVTDRFDGRLTALSMLAGWIVLTFTLTALVRNVWTTMRGDHDVDRISKWLIGTLVFTVTGGSSLVYLASEPWVYHEVYVWSTALTVGALACVIGAWNDPSWRLVGGATAFTTAAILTRMPAGLAMAVTMIVTAFARCLRDDVPRRRRWIVLACGGLVAFVSGAAVNWARFRHLYMFPIESHVWSTISPHRRFVLLRNHGRIDGPKFFWSDVVAYLRPDGIRFTPYFPFVSFPASPPRAIGGVTLDESFRTGSVPTFMTALLLPTIWAFGLVFRRRAPSGARALRVPLAGALAVTAGVLSFGYLAPRYTAEFLAVLALGAAIGVVDLARRATNWSRRGRRALLASMAGLAAFGAVANGAAGLVHLTSTSRGARLTALVTWQDRVSDLTGHPLDDHVMVVDRLPAHTPAGTLVIVGECDALYVSTGETSVPWSPVAVADTTFTLMIGKEALLPGEVTLARFAGPNDRFLTVQVGFDGRISTQIVGVRPVQRGPWLEIAAGDEIAVTIRADTARDRFVVTTTIDGNRVGAFHAVPMSEWNRRLVSTVVDVVPVASGASSESGLETGLGFSMDRARAPEVCARLR